MNKKLLSAVLISALGLPSIASEVKTITQGGAAVAQGDFTLFLTNPAHLATFGEEFIEEVPEETTSPAADPALASTDAATAEPTEGSEAAPAPSTDVALEKAPVETTTEARGKAGIGFGMSLDISAVVQDEKDLIGNVEDTVDAIEALENTFWSEGMREDALNQLRDINGGYITAKVNASFYVAVPNSVIPLSVFVNSSANAAGVVEATDALKAIENLGYGQSLNLDNLPTLDDAYAAVSGILMHDIGMSAAHEFNFGETSKLKVGASFKYQQVTLYDYTARIDDFEEDDVEDCDKKASGANIDLGVAYTYQEWLSVGFVAENLISKKYYSTEGNMYKVKPQYTFGAGVKYGIVSLLADVELVKNSGMGQVRESQYANVGVKCDFWSHASISVGYQMDMTGNEENLFCLGLGISPGNVVSLDLVGMLGDNSYGAGIRLGLKF